MTPFLAFFLADTPLALGTVSIFCIDLATDRAFGTELTELRVASERAGALGSPNRIQSEGANRPSDGLGHKYGNKANIYILKLGVITLSHKSL